MRTGDRVRFAIAVAGLFALTAGCTSTPPPRHEPGPAARRPPVDDTRPSRRQESDAPDSPARSVVDAARSRLGARYRPAGADDRGFDCSGLTWRLFREAGIALPRSAADQAEAGHWVPLDELSRGDLVFFASGDAKPHHVGIVVSAPGEPLTMIHASSSEGVVETVVTSSSYWLDRLRFGRRVLASAE